MRSKKLVIGYAIAIFLLVFIITFNSVCAITQFDARFETSSAGAAKSAETVQERLDAYLKKSFLFFKKQNVYNIVESVCEEDGTYLEVLSVKKTFPNKVTVEIAERYEQYAFYINGKYYVTDADGEILSVKESSDNNVGGSNIDIRGFTFEEPQEGQILDAKEHDMFAILMTLLRTADEKLSGARGRILSAEYITRGSGVTAKVDLFGFVFAEGIEIWLPNILNQQEANLRFSAALDFYGTLSDSEKTYGYIAPVISSESGEVICDHSDGKYVFGEE